MSKNWNKYGLTMVEYVSLFEVTANLSLKIKVLSKSKTSV